MAYPIDLVPQQLVTLPRASLATLRASLLRDAGAGYAGYLQEAGYAGGETIYLAFQDWLVGRGADQISSLSLAAFVTQAASFFHESGWGSLQVEARHDVVAVVESTDWAESDPAARLDHPSCHWTAGMFADFFGRVANGSLAVLEVECRSAGSPRCRFVVGSSEVMQHLYEQLAAGASYDDAITALA
jgi:predicted hydrocarbon binding protein